MCDTQKNDPCVALWRNGRKRQSVRKSHRARARGRAPAVHAARPLVPSVLPIPRRTRVLERLFRATPECVDFMSRPFLILRFSEWKCEAVRSQR